MLTPEQFQRLAPILAGAFYLKQSLERAFTRPPQCTWTCSHFLDSRNKVGASLRLARTNNITHASQCGQVLDLPLRENAYYIWSNRFTISIAVVAASNPLLPALVPARSIACSSVSQVITPKIVGTPVANAVLAIPFDTSALI